jgi:hypothetical protein
MEMLDDQQKWEMFNAPAEDEEEVEMNKQAKAWTRKKAFE